MKAVATPEIQALKTKLKATWESGDYGHFAQYMLPGALEFLERLNISPGTKMLDVACGAGQIAIPAAKKGADVTGIDIAANLIDQARAHAIVESVDVRFEEGDAEDLNFEDAEFDLVTSLIGAMFAPRADLVASELKRVTKPGGRIVMANWTPAGHVGQMFKAIGKHVPPSPLMSPPMQWGDEEIIRERFSDGIASLETKKYMYPMKYPFPPKDVVEFFFEYYGPTNRAYASLDDAGKTALRSDLDEVWEGNNIATDGTTHVEAEYLEVTAIRE